MSIATSFFTQTEKAGSPWYLPTDHCRGPWHPEQCHAGPPTGLLARAAEQAEPEKRLIRLTVNLLKPVPFAGFAIHCTPVHQGRTLAVHQLQLLDAQGRICVRAESQHILPRPTPGFPEVGHAYGSAETANPGTFPIAPVHELPAFNGHGVEVRYPQGHGPTAGPTTVWMKTVPLLDDETPSPFQSICPLADCGNAFSRYREVTEVMFMNPDLTLVLSRDPIGQWLGSEVRGHWEDNGMGMADALLFDEQGVVGRAIQTLLLQPRT